MISTRKQAPPTSAIQNLKIADLHAHPRAELFGDLPDDEFEALVADIKAHGVETPIIVMADRETVVSGYQRLRAAKKAGLKTVPCLVREDLADPESPDVLSLLIRDNVMRRQLTRRQIAPLAKQLAAIEVERRAAEDPGDRPKDRGLVRDAVGRVLKLSGREVDRLRNIPDLPAPVQEAFNDRLLTIKQAEMVGKLDAEAQKQIARDVKEVMEQESSSRAAKKRQLAVIVPKEGPKAKRKRKIAPIPEASPLQTVEDLLVDIKSHYETLNATKVRIQKLLAVEAEDDEHVEIRNELRAVHRLLGGMLAVIDEILGPGEKEPEEEIEEEPEAVSDDEEEPEELEEEPEEELDEEQQEEPEEQEEGEEEEE